MVSGASKTFKVLMEAVFCFKDALEGVDCSAVFLASCGKLFQQHDELVIFSSMLYFFYIDLFVALSHKCIIFFRLERM